MLHPTTARSEPSVRGRRECRERCGARVGDDGAAGPPVAGPCTLPGLKGLLAFLVLTAALACSHFGVGGFGVSEPSREDSPEYQTQRAVATATATPAAERDDAEIPPSQRTEIPTHPSSSGDCDPSYPAICVHPPPPDVDCEDIEHRNFLALQPDKHGFDPDGDGVGCGQ